jgi:hypothetical protein
MYKVGEGNVAEKAVPDVSIRGALCHRRNLTNDTADHSRPRAFGTFLRSQVTKRGEIRLKQFVI